MQVTENTYLEWAQMTLSGWGADAQASPAADSSAAQHQHTGGAASDQATIVGPVQQGMGNVVDGDVQKPKKAADGGQPASPSKAARAGVIGPVPFRDVLYHLDATPGKFMAKVWGRWHVIFHHVKL